MSVLVRGLKTVGLVLFYYVFSIGLTFYNKWTLVGFPFPLSITVCHLFLKFIMAWMCRNVLSMVTKKQPLVLDWKPYLKSVVPVAIFSALDIGLSNWSLVFITVTLYTMSKSTALIFILMFAIILKLEKPRCILVAVVALIVVGLFMFTYHSTSFDMEGFILVISASVITGLRWTTAQITLQRQELGLSNPVDVVFHLQPVMVLTLLPFAFYIEGISVSTSELVFRTGSLSILLQSVLFITTASFLAFMLGTSEYLLVYHTSGLTLSIAGVFKEIVILTISTTWWDEESLMPVNIIGMVVCLSGITTHTGVKIWNANREEREVNLDSDKDNAEVLKRFITDEEQESEDSDVLYDTSKL